MKICSRLRSLRFLLPLSLALFVACSDLGDSVEPEPCTSCVTIPADIDNTMYEALSDTNSNGRGEFLFSGKTSGGGIQIVQIRRALIRFDVANAIPAGSTVDNVTLFMTVTKVPLVDNAGAVMFHLHRLTQDWGEGASVPLGPGGGGTNPEAGDATWVHRFYPDSLWTTDGGDFAVASSGSTIVNQADVRYSWGNTGGMAADVQSWLDDAATNFGWILIGDESVLGTAKKFGSQQNSNTQLRPSLQIFYTVP